MIRTLWHNCRLWRIRASGAILLGLLLVAAQCNSTPEPTPMPTVKADPPEIIGFTLNPPGPLFPETRISIQVNVSCNGHKIDHYWWVVGAGEGSIVNGNGSPLVTYQAPEASGSYEVRVELEYKGGSPVEGSTMVEVVPKPTPTPTDTPSPTLSPTATLTPSPSATPALLLLTSMPTTIPTLLPPTATSTSIPKPTPTPTLLPPPTPISPLGEENSVNIERPTNTVNLKWQWDYSLDEVGGNALFSLRIHQVGSSEDCVHIQLRETGISEHRMTCPSGRYYWQVVVAVPLVPTPVKPSDWRNISLPSEPQYFDFVLQPDNGGGGPPPCNPPWC
jgi:hypothetical protein